MAHSSRFPQTEGMDGVADFLKGFPELSLSENGVWD